MRLLPDANLSWRMMPALKQHFADCFHVDQVGLNVPATDLEIWNYARENKLIIVTNDEDFIDLMNLKGFPPKVLLLRTGNQSTMFIANLLILRKANIQSLYQTEEYGLLEIV
jgi:predicted nuclease of predicted toxin-antitoxin system